MISYLKKMISVDERKSEEDNKSKEIQKRVLQNKFNKCRISNWHSFVLQPNICSAVMTFPFILISAKFSFNFVPNSFTNGYFN